MPTSIVATSAVAVALAVDGIAGARAGARRARVESAADGAEMVAEPGSCR